MTLPGEADIHGVRHAFPDPLGKMKIVSPHFVRKRESVFIFLGTNRSHFAQQFAIRLMK
jgi:hypothetical protein